MTDIEATRLCAEAMGYSAIHRKGDVVHEMPLGPNISGIYWPLEDDAQAMALVKRFGPLIEGDGLPPKQWFVSFFHAAAIQWHSTEDADLNRAIVYGAAAMQEATIKNRAI